MVSVKINGEEIKNPVVRLLVSVFVLFVALFILGLLLLIFLPIVWFSVLMVLSGVILLMAIGPKILKNYRIIVLEKKNQAPHRRLKSFLPCPAVLTGHIPFQQVHVTCCQVSNGQFPNNR